MIYDGIGTNNKHDLIAFNKLPFLDKEYNQIISTDEKNIFDYMQDFTRMCCDRFGYLNKYSIWKFPDYGLYPMPNQIKCLTLEEIFYNRVQYFINKAKKENKDIYIANSGGVDSVCAIACFLKYRNDYDLKNFHILYSQSSIKEYPSLIIKLKQLGIDCIFGNSNNFRNIWVNAIKNHIVITGNAAETVGPSDYLESRNEDEWLFKNYLDYLKKKKKWDDNSIQQAEDFMKFYNINETTTNAFWWISNFCLLFTSTKYYLNIQFHLEEPIYPFYDGIELNDWGMCNYQKLISYTVTDKKLYKLPQKKIIYDFFHDEYYLNNKIHEGSWKSVRQYINKGIENLFTIAYTDCYKVYNNIQDIKTELLFLKK